MNARLLTPDRSEKLWIFDVEGVLILWQDESKRKAVGVKCDSALGVLCLNYIDEVPGRDRIRLKLLALALSMRKKLLKDERFAGMRRKLVKDDPDRRILKTYEEKFLKMYTPPENLIYRSARKVAEMIEPQLLDLISDQEGDKYLLSIGAPKRFVHAMLEHLGAEEIFKEVVANDLRVEEDRIVGFNWEGAFFGAEGKKAKTREIKSRYSSSVEVISVGDGYADLGMFEESNIAYVMEHADEEVKNYVRGRFGKDHILPDLKSLFQLRKLYVTVVYE